MRQESASRRQGQERTTRVRNKNKEGGNSGNVIGEFSTFDVRDEIAALLLYFFHVLHQTRLFFLLLPRFKCLHVRWTLARLLQLNQEQR